MPRPNPRRFPSGVVCDSSHECACGHGHCTRLAHTGVHRCIWCGTEWRDEQVAS